MIEQKLARLGIVLPAAAVPAFQYVPVTVHERQAFVSGQLPREGDEVRVGADYRLEEAKITNVAQDAARAIRDEEGSSTISSVTPRLSRNTLNHAFDPTAGSFQDISLEFAGLGL